MTTETERKIEIVGQFKNIQVRDTVHILEDGVRVATKAPNRFVIGPLDPAPCAECQSLKDLYHTPELIAEYEASVTSA
jgi:hypothetical protein